MYYSVFVIYFKTLNIYSLLFLFVSMQSPGNTDMPTLSHLQPHTLLSGSSPGALCANRASCITANFGWIALGSGSIGTGDPSLDRLSGVWTPLECADSTPE